MHCLRRISELVSSSRPKLRITRVVHSTAPDTRWAPPARRLNPPWLRPGPKGIRTKGAATLHDQLWGLWGWGRSNGDVLLRDRGGGNNRGAKDFCQSSKAPSDRTRGMGLKARWQTLYWRCTGA
jgi:hypothetical protein